MCSNAANVDTAFANRAPLVFSNLSSEPMPVGTPVEFVFDHAAVVAAGNALESGDDLRVVLADGTDTVLVHGIEVGPNLPNTRVVFPLQAAVAEVDQTPLACSPRFGSFLSSFAKSTTRSTKSTVASTPVMGLRLDASRCVDNEQAGTQVLNTSFSELGGSCCSPVVDGFFKESVNLASRDFTVTMTSDEFSGSNRFYGCTAFGTGSNLPPGSETRRYTVVDNPRLKASLCGR